MNKLSSLVCSLILVVSFANAQTSSGNMMVGGSLAFETLSHEASDVNNTTSFSFSPSFGYFLNDNLAVGASISVGSAKTGTGDAKTVSSSFGFGPFARYYMFTSNERFAFFGQAGLNFGTGKTNPPIGADNKTSSISFSVAPGAAYFLNDHWALELALAGISVRSSDPNTANDNDKTTRFNFGVSSFSPSLAFRYHF